jgi:toxin ParE1/3/4
MYKLVLLPIAGRDLQEIIKYIEEELYSPLAALNFVRLFRKKVKIALTYPYAFPVRLMPGLVEQEYRILPLKNYLLFYIIREESKTIEIYRIVYAKRDLTKI